MRSPDEMAGARRRSSVVFLRASLLLLPLLLLSSRWGMCDGFPIWRRNSSNAAEIDESPGRGCGGRKVGECSLPTATEAPRRRILAGRPRYISYGTLRRDMVLCQNPGASYYNCHPHPANRYHRGCEVITYCARNL